MQYYDENTWGPLDGDKVILGELERFRNMGV